MGGQHPSLHPIKTSYNYTPPTLLIQVRTTVWHLDLSDQPMRSKRKSLWKLWYMTNCCTNLSLHLYFDGCSFNPPGWLLVSLQVNWISPFYKEHLIQSMLVYLCTSWISDSQLGCNYFRPLWRRGPPDWLCRFYQRFTCWSLKFFRFLTRTSEIIWYHAYVQAWGRFKFPSQIASCNSDISDIISLPPITINHIELL